MLREEHSTPVYKWQLLPGFWLTMGFLPKRHRLPLCAGFTLSMARFVHDNTISKEVCRVFVLRCQSASRLTCQVSSHRVHLSHTFYAVLQVTFIHPCIHTSILSCIHLFMHTQCICIHNINSHKVASVAQSLVRPYLSDSVLTYHYVKRQVPTNEQLVVLIFIKKCHP